MKRGVLRGPADQWIGRALTWEPERRLGGPLALATTGSTGFVIAADESLTTREMVSTQNELDISACAQAFTAGARGVKVQWRIAEQWYAMRNRASTADHRQRLQSLQRGVALLREFTADRPEWGLTELAEELDLNKTIVHRIVRTFEEEGFLARRNGKYVLGPDLLDLSSVILNSIDLREVARPVIERLSAETGETVFLTVVRGNRSVCVEKVESRQRMRLTLDIGRHYPLYAGASNKVLLAFLELGEQERVLAEPFEVFTERTPRDPESLRRELESIREAGWSTTTGELTPHATAVAVPLRDPVAEVVGALSVSGPESRLTDIEGTVRLLERAATDIGAALLSWRSVAQQGVRTVGRPNQEETAT